MADRHSSNGFSLYPNLSHSYSILYFNPVYAQHLLLTHAESTAFILIAAAGPYSVYTNMLNMLDSSQRGLLYLQLYTLTIVLDMLAILYRV